MSWLRLDSDFASDGTVRRCKAVLWWPLILCALKRGNGVASDDDISAEVLADIGQGDEESAARAVERLKAAGLLVAVEGGWTTPRWSEVQQDPSASDRARRYRERNRQAQEAASRCVTVTERDDTVRHGDVTPENGTSRLTVRDSTGQYIHETDPVTGGGSTTPRARAVEPHPPTPTPAPDGLAEVCEAFRLTQQRGGMFVAPATVQALADMTAQHGAATVKEAIARGHESARGGLTLAYLRPVVEAVARGEPRGRPVRQPNADTTGRHTSRSTDEFGPRPLAPGEL